MAIRVLVPLNPVVRVLVPPNPFARTHHYLALLSALRGLGRSDPNRRGLRPAVPLVLPMAWALGTKRDWGCGGEASARGWRLRRVFDCALMRGGRATFGPKT